MISWPLLMILSVLLLRTSCSPLIHSDTTSDSLPVDGGSVASVAGGSVVAFVSTAQDSVGGAHRQFTILQAYDYSGNRIGNRVVICEHRTPAIPPQVSAGEESAVFHVLFVFGTSIRHVEGEVTSTGITVLTPNCEAGTDYAGPEQQIIRAATSMDGTLTAMVLSTWIGGQTQGIQLRIFKGEYYSVESPLYHVHPFAYNLQSNPDVAVLGNHTIVVVWQDILNERIYEIHFDENGVATTPLRFPAVGLNQTGYLSAPVVQALIGTEYAVGWKYTGGTLDELVEGGRVPFGSSYIRVYSDLNPDLKPWRASADHGFTGHVLSISPTLDNNMWLVYSANGYINGKYFGKDGHGDSREFRLFAQITTHAADARVSTASLIPFGIVFTFSDGVHGSITTYFWDGYQTTDNPIPPSDLAQYQAAYTSLQHPEYGL